MKNRVINNFPVSFIVIFYTIIFSLFYYLRYTFTRVSSQVFLFTFAMLSVFFNLLSKVLFRSWCYIYDDLVRPRVVHFYPLLHSFVLFLFFLSLPSLINSTLKFSRSQYHHFLWSSSVNKFIIHSSHSPSY